MIQIQQTMKKILIISGIIAAFLCLAQNANAQYARQGANIVDKSGYVLSDSQLTKLVGNEVFQQTVVGARKQYKAGKTLIWSGAGGLVGGAVLYGAGLAKIADKVTGNSSKEEIQKALEANPGSAGMILGGTLLMAAGGVALDAGIPLLIIGKKRLDWVEGQANAAKGYSIDLGATPYGVGLAVRF